MTIDDLDQDPIVGNHAVISGWGNSTPVSTHLRSPIDVAQVMRCIPADAPVIARGLGRSYGDAAQLAGGVTIDITGLADVLEFDERTGMIRVHAGISIEQLMRDYLPRGWFVPVVPGTGNVTVGGAIASDIHGKNHHSHGSFGSHVKSLAIVDGAGDVQVLSPDTEPELFWATVGGMGLTGIIVEATIQLRPVESTSMWATSYRVPDLAALMAEMVDSDTRSPYSVAWIDTVSRGRSFGRGVLSHGDHAKRGDFAPGIDPAALDIDKSIAVPVTMPNGLLNQVSVRAFNEFWYRAAPAHSRWKVTSASAFFHPLDKVTRWNRIYGSRGFVQYQFAVPDSGADLIQIAIERLQRVGGASFLSVLKRFGEGNQAPLSFPIKGWTLALDIPAGVTGLGTALDQLDALVAEAGGRVYLSKDARLRPDVLAAMYPRLPEWQAARAQTDPTGKFESDMSRRLNL